MTTVISVENLSKSYRLGQIGTGLLTDDLRVWWANLRGKPNPVAIVDKEMRHRPGETIWALRDINFQVQQGEVLGIIGRNGAGKSTLLKILSRVTAPTTGQIKVKGRIASLLEVGTGFHPDLTGRENIFLNGAILGMSRAEVTRKLDEIIAFAEIEKFIDTPVKRYSSGMYVRLAFAVAAHLEPEILLVDEVLAVGDAEFQKKCLGKMGDVAHQGRTVLFVSHNMVAMENLCNSAILLKQGKIDCNGDIQTVVSRYREQTNTPAVLEKRELNLFRPHWAKPLITAIRLIDSQGNETTSHFLGEDITVEMEFRAPQGLRRPVMGVVIKNAVLGTVGGINTRMTGIDFGGGPYLQGKMQCVLQKVNLLQGSYNMDIWLGDGTADIDNINGALPFVVEPADVYNTGKTPFHNFGVIFLHATWNLTNEM